MNYIDKLHRSAEICVISRYYEVYPYGNDWAIPRYSKNNMIPEYIQNINHIITSRVCECCDGEEIFKECNTLSYVHILFLDYESDTLRYLRIFHHQLVNSHGGDDYRTILTNYKNGQMIYTDINNNIMPNITNAPDICNEIDNKLCTDSIVNNLSSNSQISKFITDLGPLVKELNPLCFTKNMEINTYNLIDDEVIDDVYISEKVSNAYQILKESADCSNKK
jgi:hypothetical protein